MKKIILGITIISLFSCQKKDPNRPVEIRGKLTNSSGEMIYIEELTPTAVNIKDSVLLNADGEFKIQLKVPEIGFYRLKTKTQNNFIVLILDTIEDIRLKAEADNLSKTYSIEGSEESILLWGVNKMQLKIYDMQDSLKNIFMQAQNSPYADSIGRKLESEFQIAVNQFQTNLKELIEKNHNSFAALAAIENFDSESEKDLFLKVEKALTEKYPNSIYVKSLSRRIAEINKVSIGSPAPVFSLPNTDGNMFSIEALKGKIVLIDFWASWCKPCRAENPNMVKIYNKYKGRGFEILGVSLDKDKEQWKKAIKDDKLTWNQVSDLAFWNSIVVPMYGIKSIPYTVLIDKEGNVIAKGLRGSELEKVLETTFK